LSQPAGISLIHDDANFLLELNSCSGSTKAHDPGNIFHIQNSDNTPEITYNVDYVSEIMNCVDNLTENKNCNNIDSDGNISTKILTLRRSRRIKKIPSYIAYYHHQVANIHKGSNTNFKIKYPLSFDLTYDFLSDKY